MLANQIEGQRPLRKTRLAKLVGEMTRGEWQHNPLDSIGVTPDGKLLNGQHRLAAVVQTGLPQAFSIVYGVNPDIYRVLDQGLPRSMSDYFKSGGETNATELAAVVAWQFREEAGLHSQASGGPYRLDARLSPTTHQADDVLARHPRLRDVVKVHSRVAEPGRLLPKSITNWTYYRFSRVDAEAADVFWEGVGSGVGLTSADPRYALRKVLLRRAEGETRGRSSEFVAALVVKGWNAFLRGKSVKVIAWREDEQFPRISGE